MSNYKISKLQYSNFADLVPCESDTGECFYKYRKTGMAIQANISRMSEEEVANWKPKYFLLSSDEAKQMTTTFYGKQFLLEEGRVMVRSLTKFMAKSSQKRIYLRQLPHPVNSWIEYGFFSDDILEIIPLILKQQGNPIGKNNGLLSKYRKEWPPTNVASRVISTQEAIDVFDQFNINKSLITVVPDLQYHHSIKKRFENGTETLATFNHNSQKSVYVQEAMWMVFKELICGFDWNEIQNSELRCQIIDAMDNMNVPGVTMFTLNSVQYYLRHIKSSPFFSTPEANKPSRKLDYFFTKKFATAWISNSEYQQMADTFHLTKYETDPEEDILVWKARVYMATAWIKQFFGKEEHVLQENLMHGVRYFVLEPVVWMDIQGSLFPDLLNAANDQKSEPKETPKTNESTQNQPRTPPTTPSPLSNPSEAVPLPLKTTKCHWSGAKLSGIAGSAENMSDSSETASNSSEIVSKFSETVAAFPLPWNAPTCQCNGSKNCNGSSENVFKLSGMDQELAETLAGFKKAPLPSESVPTPSGTVPKLAGTFAGFKKAPLPSEIVSDSSGTASKFSKSPDAVEESIKPYETVSTSSETVPKPSGTPGPPKSASEPYETYLNLCEVLKNFPKLSEAQGPQKVTKPFEIFREPSEYDSIPSGTVSNSSETAPVSSEIPAPPEMVSTSSQTMQSLFKTAPIPSGTTRPLRTISRSCQTMQNLPETPEPSNEALNLSGTVRKPFKPLQHSQPQNAKPSQAAKFKSKSSDVSPPPQPNPTDPSNESKLCDKCNRNGKALNKAKTALAEAQTKANKYEAQAKEANEMEKKMKKLRKENETLQKDMKDMKVEKKRSDVREKVLEDKVEKLNWKVEDLEGKLKNEQQEKTNCQEESAMLRRNFERLQVHVAKRESKRPNVNRPSFTSTPPSSIMSVNDWVKAKEDFETDEAWVVAKKKMIESLLSKTTDPEIRRYCQFELSQYVGSIQLYETIINLNIEKINFTGDTSDLQPLPTYPHLSQRFIDLFNATLKEEAEEEPSDPDNECYICSDSFKEGEKRVFCPVCKHPVHLKCEEDWEKAQKKNMIKELSCGHCRAIEGLKEDLEKENRNGKQ